MFVIEHSTFWLTGNSELMSRSGSDEMDASIYDFEANLRTGVHLHWLRVPDGTDRASLGRHLRERNSHFNSCCTQTLWFTVPSLHHAAYSLLSSRPSFVNCLHDFLGPPHRVRVCGPLLETRSREPISIDCGNALEEL